MEASIRLKTRNALCPDCRAEVRLVGRLLIGEVIGCSACGSQLEVARTDPVELERIAKVEAEEEDFQ